MITVSKQENGVLFTFENSDKYLYGSGTIEVPFNSLSIIQDESDNITLRKSASNDIFLSARYDTDFGYASKEAAVEALKEILYDEAGISEEEVQEMIDAATSGIPSSEVVEQLRRDVNAVSGEVDTKQDILTAGENITISGNVISADAGNNIIELTQAEYDALETKDPDVLYIITDAQEINMNDYYTKSEVDASIATKADSSALTAVNNVLTTHTANTEVHVTQAEKNTWNGKLDASAYTPTDLSEYWTSAQTQSAINAATSGIPSSQVVEQLRTDINTVSGEVENKQDALQYYSEIDDIEESFKFSHIEVRQGTDEDNVSATFDVSTHYTEDEKMSSVDLSAAVQNDNGFGSSEISVYNGQINLTNDYEPNEGEASESHIFMSQNGSIEIGNSNEDGGTLMFIHPTGVTINYERVLTESDLSSGYLIDLDTIMQRGLTDAEWDGTIDAIANNRLVYIKRDGMYYTIEFYRLDGNTMNLVGSDGEAAATYTIQKLGSNQYTLNYSTRWLVSETQKDTWNAKADASALTSIESAVTAVSNDLNTLSGAVIDNEYTVSQAINSLNNRVTAVESGGTGGGITSGEVQTMIDDSLDIYWTSAQTQSAIDAAKAYYISFATIATTGIRDEDWDGIVAAIDDHRPIYAGYPRNDGGIVYYGVECMDKNVSNTQIVLISSDNTSHYFYTFTKNGSNDYSYTVERRPYTTQAEKDAWNAKQDALSAGTGISISNNVISTSGVVMSQQVTQIVKLTQAAYDALSTKDAQTLYIVVD